METGQKRKPTEEAQDAGWEGLFAFHRAREVRDQAMDDARRALENFHDRTRALTAPPVNGEAVVEEEAVVEQPVGSPSVDRTVAALQQENKDLRQKVAAMEKERDDERLQKDADERYRVQVKERREAKIMNTGHLDPRSNEVLTKLHQKLEDEGGWLDEDEDAVAKAWRSRLTHMYEGRILGLEGWNAEMYAVLFELGHWSRRLEEKPGDVEASAAAERMRGRVAAMRREVV